MPELQAAPSPRRRPRPALSVYPLEGIGEVAPGADVADLLATALCAGGLRLRRWDVLVVAQKIVSKAERRLVNLDDVVPSPAAIELALMAGKDPRLVEVILAESEAVVRAKPGVIITRHRLGFVMAQAGIDRSNVVPGHVLLLPISPDASASRLRAALQELTGIAPGIIISDSFGRPWRLGTTNVAIGAAGVPAVWDRRGETDRHQRRLETTVIGWADAVAAAAGMAMGEVTEGIPAALVRGLRWSAPDQPASTIVRPVPDDLFP